MRWNSIHRFSYSIPFLRPPSRQRCASLAEKTSNTRNAQIACTFHCLLLVCISKPASALCTLVSGAFTRGSARPNSRRPQMQCALATSGVQTPQMMQRQPVGLSSSSRLAARLLPAGRVNALRAASAASSQARQRASLRVAATADPAVKLSGDDLKEANRKAMRTVRVQRREGPRRWRQACEASGSACAAARRLQAQAAPEVGQKGVANRAAQWHGAPLRVDLTALPLGLLVGTPTTDASSHLLLEHAPPMAACSLRLAFLNPGLPAPLTSRPPACACRCSTLTFGSATAPPPATGATSPASLSPAP